jgi:hypothetical protein
MIVEMSTLNILNIKTSHSNPSSKFISLPGFSDWVRVSRINTMFLEKATLNTLSAWVRVSRINTMILEIATLNLLNFKNSHF